MEFLQETDYIRRAPHHQYNLTDRLRHVLSGAMHEETCIPGVLTLRDNTWRPAGSNVLAGTEAMIRCARSMLERGNRWKNPFGDGRAGERIIEISTKR
ncbi:MAG: hypothetical protein Q8M95_06120 [Candidatus Methanoperedens sp.]|nr:hypothetical protein [Candidatus Methanoperedens sp.]